jgi:hypothetical protein
MQSCKSLNGKEKMMTKELLKLPNVRLGNKCEHFKEEVLHTEAKALAWEVATKHPLWTIEIIGFRDYNVKSDGEVIGKIGAEYYGSSQKLYVRNDRIGLGNTRKNAYHTDKVDKAMLKVKKTFGRMTLSERMSKAYKEAEKVVDSQAWSINSREREHERPIERKKMDYVNAMHSQFVAWLKETRQADTLEHLTKLEEVQADMMTIKEVTTAMQNNNTALIVLSDGKYVVKIRDNVQLYDDVTLPSELRGKLGMLKLVEEEAMVTGIGCRVSDEIFVLLTESKDV